MVNFNVSPFQIGPSDQLMLNTPLIHQEGNLPAPNQGAYPRCYKVKTCVCMIQEDILAHPPCGRSEPPCGNAIDSCCGDSSCGKCLHARLFSRIDYLYCCFGLDLFTLGVSCMRIGSAGYLPGCACAPECLSCLRVTGYGTTGIGGLCLVKSLFARCLCGLPSHNQ